MCGIKRLESTTKHTAYIYTIVGDMTGKRWTQTDICRGFALPRILLLLLVVLLWQPYPKQSAQQWFGCANLCKIQVPSSTDKQNLRYRHGKKWHTTQPRVSSLSVPRSLAKEENEGWLAFHSLAAFNYKHDVLATLASAGQRPTADAHRHPKKKILYAQRANTHTYRARQKLLL